jgi:hypothetical protein
LRTSAGAQLVALTGVHRDREVALEQDEGFVVGEVPVERAGVRGEERDLFDGCLHAGGAQQAHARVGLSGDDVVTKVVRDPAVAVEGGDRDGCRDRRGW